MNIVNSNEEHKEGQLLFIIEKKWWRCWIPHPSIYLFIQRPSTTCLQLVSLLFWLSMSPSNFLSHSQDSITPLRIIVYRRKNHRNVFKNWKMKLSEKGAQLFLQNVIWIEYLNVQYYVLYSMMMVLSNAARLSKSGYDYSFLILNNIYTNHPSFSFLVTNILFDNINSTSREHFILNALSISLFDFVQYIYIVSTV